MKVLQKRNRMVFFFVLLLGLCMAGFSSASAAPAGMIAKALANTDAKGKLVTTAKGVRFRHADGTLAKKEWLSVKNTPYYFNKEGYARTGWFTIDGKRYYAKKDGMLLYSKWVVTGTNTYYVKKDGTKAVSCWITRGGKRYYVNKNGVLQKSRQLHLGGKYYYVNNKGAMLVKTWVTRGGKRYFFGKDGARLQKVWIRYKGKYYYMKANGVMAVNRWVGSYYVGSDGARLTNTTVDGWVLGEDGRKTGEQVKSLLVVGDSRVVGMSSSVSAKNTSFIGEIGVGYSWLTSTGISKMKKLITGKTNMTVLLCFGVNDVGNADKYITYYKSLMTSYPKVKFYVMSVNPIEEARARSVGYNISTAQIQAINKKFKAAFGTKYLDAYTWLQKNGFSTFDGLHYEAATYRKLYNWLSGKFL